MDAKTKEYLKVERNIIMQAFAELYVTEFGMPKEIEGYDVPDKYGDISKKDAALLHCFLTEQYSRVGLDLNSCIEKSGETIVPGKLSKYECDELLRRADEMILLLKIIFDRRDRHRNKEI